MVCSWVLMRIKQQRLTANSMSTYDMSISHVFRTSFPLFDDNESVILLFWLQLGKVYRRMSHFDWTRAPCARWKSCKTIYQSKINHIKLSCSCTKYMHIALHQIDRVIVEPVIWFCATHRCTVHRERYCVLIGWGREGSATELIVVARQKLAQ